MATPQISLPKLTSKDVKATGANGVNGANGAMPPQSPTLSASTYGGRSSYALKTQSMSGSVSGDATLTTLLQNTAQTLEKRSTVELGYGVYESIARTTFIDLVEHIGTERLSSLPHKGSKWDKVLMRSLYFAEQQHGFEKMLKSFAVEDTSLAHLGYGYAKLLLELGHENAVALDKAFAVLYKYSLEVSALLYRTELVSTTAQIREQLSYMYGDLLSLTSAVAIRYYKAVHGMASTKMSLDIYEVCGDVIDSFRDRQAQVSDLIWARQAQLEGTDIEHGVSPRTLKRWLMPMDRVLSTLSEDHMALLGGQAEFTCLWFQKPLTSFVQGTRKVMGVTGASGFGKSVLAASIAERLQRSLGRQTFSTLFYSISSSVPSAATPIVVLKSLLAQIFALRVGNMGTYHAVARAYEQCRHSSDEKEYENHLWAALDEALKKPLDHARDLIVVVDGIDELRDGPTVGEAFFNKLAGVVSEGKRVKLIGLAQSLSYPAGVNATRVDMTLDNLHEDLHAVIIKSLMHSHHFTVKQGPEQEQLIERLVKASRGSFIWATLVGQLLLDAKTADEFTKSVDYYENSKPTIQDLVQRTVTRHELTATTKTVLGWIISAERPLTIFEIRTLLSSGVHDAPHASDKSVNVHSVLHNLESVLLFNEGIVRFKHPTIQQIVGTLVESGKINIPAATRHSDLLMRLLNYARVTLKEEPDPSFDEYDATSLERTFREHPLLIYVVRFWAVHLQYLGSKAPQDISKVLPDTALLPQMERTFWGMELPLSRSLELFKTVTYIRQTTLKELSAATLQSTLNTAIVYDTLDRQTDAASLYYTCTKISRNLLSNYHPLPIECGSRYLVTSEKSITTTRTEVMTRREEVLKVLITLYERQFGRQSSQVIEVKTKLAQLYEHIQEQERAMEIYQSIQTDTVHVYGRNSTQAREVSDQLHVVLGKVQPEKKIETRTDTIFDEEEEPEYDDTLDVKTVSRDISAAKDERTLVELWQRISSICRTTTSAEWHEKNIDVAMAYAEYLKKQKRTEESTSIASSVAREYESNQASFSDSVVSKLHTVANFMKDAGEFTVALLILKRTTQFFQSTRRSDSTQYAESQKQMTSIMTQMIQSKSIESHEGVVEDYFRSIIKDQSKPVDAKLMGIAKTLTTQHMEEAKLTEAIDIIKLTLTRTWPAFVTRSSNDVEMTTSFPKESVELAEFMIECYIRLRMFDAVESNLLRLYNASLTLKTVDFAFVTKIKTQLITYYDEHNYAERSVTVLQKLLPVQQASLGATNEETIRTLYELGRRSREKARAFPFWIDYYQQIVTAFSKDSKTVHTKAMDALLVVTTTYWEDRRYTEALSSYTLLWTTFVEKPKEFSQFSQADFVEKLHTRYYSVLEQTGARFETLYQMTTQYRKTAITIFGAQSTVTTNATLSLARICNSSEEHHSEAMGWYEEAAKTSGSNSRTSSEIKSALAVLFATTIVTTTSTSSTTKTENVQRALSQASSQYSSSVAKYGYAHESSLARLKEIALLHFKQNNTESATKELTTATREIVSKETSSSRMIEAAETIVASFVAINSVEYCKTLVTQLHKQVVAKDRSSTSSWGFDVTKYGRSVLAFIAAMELRLSKDTTLSFSQIMAELTTEMMYYEDYRRLVSSNANLQSILIAASTLRRFLLKAGRDEMVAHVDTEVGQLFVTRDGSRLKLKSSASGKIFMVAIMKYLGAHKTSSFAKAVILASNESLEELMATEKYAEAYDIAGCAFAFAVDYQGYNGAKGISHGFNLASILAGIGYAKKCPDANLRKQMLHLSNEIVKKVLEICKAQNIDFAQVQLKEINRLIVLLGEQEDYETLEWLLTTLWNSRSAQRTWSPRTLHNLGRLLICTRYMAGHPIKALRLCEDVAYNMRRTRGASHPATTDTNVLLAQLYTSSGLFYLSQKDKSSTDLSNAYFGKALAVHEEMLRLLVNDLTDGGIPGIDDDEDMDTTGAILAEFGISLDGEGRVDYGATAGEGEYGKADQTAMAKMHLRLLKLAFQRLGGWPKSSVDYDRLIAQAIEVFEIKDAQPADKWSAKGFGNGKAESNDDSFQKVESWKLIES